MEGLFLCSANYVPLSPISFLERAAFAYGNRVSIIYGATKYLWKDTEERCIKLASALSQLGITSGDIVAAVAPNLPALYELHFGVPMAGAILSALNTKLDASDLALRLEQLGAKIVFVDYQFINVVKEALTKLSQARSKPSIIVSIQESKSESPANNSRELSVEKVLDYDELLAMGHADFKIIHPNDERNPISVNFTSGSTGEPKGAVYSHRAAYLNSIAQIFRAEMRQMPVFLWTVDMFRCNGWCFPWTMAALGGTNVCLRDVTGEAVFDAIFHHRVTHFCGSPAMLTKVVEAVRTADHQCKLPHNVNVIVAGVMPPSEVQIKLESLGFQINHAYGMTEALSVVTSNQWTSGDVDQSHEDEEATIRIRQGIHNIMMEEVDVKDPVTMESVPHDGKTIGEIRFRSNTMMLGYLNNPQATQEAFDGGWYRTRDLGIRHPNGSIEFKDRAADIINCGGETISTPDVEAVLIRHPVVSEAAVVGRPHNCLGETPCAFVKLKEGMTSVASEEIMKFCSCHLPSHMTPQTVVIGDLPINAAGKIQKFALRDKARIMNSV